MKKAISHLAIVGVLTAVMLLTGAVSGGWWWIFVVPVVAAGAGIGARGSRLPAFFLGFSSGFLYWAGLNLYFNAVFPGIIFAKFPVDSRWLILTMAGLTGGILAGLAFTAGRSLGLIWRLSRRPGNLERTAQGH
jgi:hypothetical protein